MKNKEIIIIFMQEIDTLSEDNMIAVNRAKEILRLLAIAIDNEKECEQIEARLDKDRIFERVYN